MRKTKEEAAVTRQSVLDAALVVFSEKGYAATKLEDIAERAGMTRGAIYWHFENKAVLYQTLVREVSSRVESVMMQAIEEGGSFVEIARRLLVRSLTYLEDDEQYRLVMELTLFKTARLPELEEGLQMKMQGINATIETLANFVQEGIRAGELRDDLNPRETATSFFSLQNGLVMTWLLCERAFSLKDNAIAAAEIFVRGIAR
jgi:TetR/AcrR family transcriptional regulator, acrAB operon repressor